ncbi:MAG: hypothetical protein WCH43_11730 [Verrucomicrobiota bacterium]
MAFTIQTLNRPTGHTLTIAQGVGQTTTSTHPAIPAPCAEGEIETSGEAGGSNA